LSCFNQNSRLQLSIPLSETTLLIWERFDLIYFLPSCVLCLLDSPIQKFLLFAYSLRLLYAALRSTITRKEVPESHSFVAEEDVVPVLSIVRREKIELHSTVAGKEKVELRSVIAGPVSSPLTTRWAKTELCGVTLSRN